MARITVEVIAESVNEFDTKKGPVKEQILSCIDRSPDLPRIKHAFDYVMSAGEASVYSAKLIDKRIVIGFESFGEDIRGTPRVTGRILEADGKKVG